MMKNKSRYCPMCKKRETRAECSYGPRIWDMVTIDEEFLPEARKRDKAEAAIFAAALAATMAQSPKEIVKFGHLQSPGVAYMDNMMRKRGKATVSGLDNPRVSEPARNRKIKGQPKVKSTIGEEIDKKTLIMLMIKKLIAEKRRKNYLLNYGYIGEAKTPAWTRNAGKDLKKGGLNKKGIASYRREHPGSKLSMAVTTEPSKLKKGSKKWKRRKSFCARMSGMPGPMKDEKGRPTRKALSLRKWNC